jgi:quinol monooxygenase YgiN
VLKLTLRLDIKPRSIDEATHVLRSLVGTVRAEPGCCATRLVQCLDAAASVTFVEEWRSRDDLQRHLRSLAFRRILAVMELAARAPTLEIDDVSSRRGFDLVEELLGHGRPDAEGRAAVGYQEVPGR